MTTHITHDTTHRFETLASAAERTGFSVKTLRRRISDGRLPAYRNGPRSLRVKPEDVDRLFERSPMYSSRQ